MGKFVLLISRFDFAGSGNKMAEAVSLNTKHYVLPIITNPYLFPTNLRRVPSLYKMINNKLKTFSGDADRVQELVNKADIIHFKGDSLPTENFINGVIIPKDKPTIITVSGTFFRRGNSSVAHPLAKISEYLNVTDFRSTITPDLNYPEFDSHYIPHAFNEMEYKWKNRKVPLIVHATAINNKKGTKEFKEACKILKEEGIRFNVDIIEGEPYNETMRRKSEATIFFDQISELGWFGLSGIESISMGIPTIGYISGTSLKQGNIKQTSFIDCGKTIESLTETLRGLLKKDLTEKSKEVFEYAKNNYSYEVVGKTWGKVYENL